MIRFDGVDFAKPGETALAACEHEFHALIERALRTRIHEIEGEIPELEAVMLHARAVVDYRPAESFTLKTYTWKGTPIVEVRWDGLKVTVTELRPK